MSGVDSVSEEASERADRSRKFRRVQMTTFAKAAVEGNPMQLKSAQRKGRVQL